MHRELRRRQRFLNRVAGIRLVSTFLLIALTFSLPALPVAAKTKVVHLNADHGPEFVRYLEDRAAAFSKLYPDIEIELLSAVRDVTQVATNRILAGVQVDVLDSTHSYMVFAGLDMLADLRPYLEADGVDIEASFLPTALDVVSQDGRILGLPSQVYTIATVYNVTLFDEAGLPTPQQLGADWSWQWILDEGRKLVVDRDGDGVTDQYGIFVSPALTNIYPVVHQAGGMVFDRYLNPTQSLFNTQPVLEGLEYMEELFRSGIAANMSYPDFYNGRRAAVALRGIPTHLSYISQSIDDFGVAHQPYGPVRKGGHTYFAPYHVIKSHDPERESAATKWIRFLALDVESQVLMMQMTGRIPGYVPALSNLRDALLGYSQEEQAFLSDYVPIAMDADNFPNYLTSAEGAIGAAFDAGFARVLSGQEALGNFLIQIHETAQIELNR